MLTSGVWLAIGGTFLFALKSIFIKLAYAAGTDAETLLALRMLLAAPFYGAMLCWLKRETSHENSREHSANPPLSLPLLLRLLGLAFLGYYLASILDLWGLELISAQLERLTLFTYPTLIALLSWLLGRERLTLKVITALLLSYIGIGCMSWGEQLHSSSQDLLPGVLLVLGSALSFACYVVLARPLLLLFGSRRFTALVMLGSTLFVLLHFAISQPLSSLLVSRELLGYALLLAFVSTVLPSFMVNAAIARIGATRATILGSAGPVFTFGLAVWWLQEPTSFNHLIGTLLVIAGVTLVSYTPKGKS